MKQEKIQVEEVKNQAPPQAPEIATADDIDSATDVVIQLFEIPEFKKSVYIRSLDTDQVELLGDLLQEAKDKKLPFDSLKWLAAEFMVDKNGKQLMSFQRLKQKRRSVKGLKRVVEIGMHLSGMSQEFRDSIKEALKGDPLDASASESPSRLEGLLASP